MTKRGRHTGSFRRQSQIASQSGDLRGIPDRWLPSKSKFSLRCSGALHAAHKQIASRGQRVPAPPATASREPTVLRTRPTSSTVSRRRGPPRLRRPGTSPTETRARRRRSGGSSYLRIDVEARASAKRTTPAVQTPASIQPEKSLRVSLGGRAAPRPVDRMVRRSVAQEAVVVFDRRGRRLKALAEPAVAARDVFRNRREALLRARGFDLR